MESEGSDLLHCYNKGCGIKFDPKENKQDSCCFHPGNPVFHDAYKGWSCCNRKSIDFTEFLNLKGCTISFHSNVKPPEAVKPVVEKPKSNELYEYMAPAPRVSTLERPLFSSRLIKVQPEISNLLKSQVESLIVLQLNAAALATIDIGTSCKNAGCKATYEGPSTNDSGCIYHCGAPVFHEGLKYWSCCKKKTTDFSVFLDQVGCTTGDHVWIKEKSITKQSNCRHDWHQTGSHVFISVYAKNYDPEKSSVELNPIRSKIQLYFPSDDSKFNMDFELHGIIDIDKSGVSMLPTKVEVKLKKAEPGSWPKLGMPAFETATESKKMENQTTDKECKSGIEHDPVDLSDVC